MKQVALFFILLGGCLPTLAAEPGKAITADLPTFTFTRREGVSASAFGYDEKQGRMFFFTNGTATGTLRTPSAGEYVIVVRAACTSALDERAKFTLTIDGEPVGKETVLTTDEPRDYRFTTGLTAGIHSIAIAFTNDAHQAGVYDRNLYIHAISAETR